MVQLLGAGGLLSIVTLQLTGLLAAAVFTALLVRGPIAVATVAADEPPPGRWLAGGILVIALVTMLLSLTAPPNSSDGMSYHLPRILHWLDQGGLGMYYTAIDRQLWQPPFAEYLVAVGLAAGGGTDRLVGLPQWIALVGTAMAAAEVARLFGVARAGRWGAAAVVLTIPTALVQSGSTQNDLLAALWVLTTAWLALRRWTGAAAFRGEVLVGGIAAGLAIGTKGTAAVLVLPWLVVWGLARLRGGGWAAATREAALLIVVVVALNATHWLATAEVFDTFLGPSSVHRILRPESAAPGVLAGNLVANLSLHAGAPWPGWNDAVAGAVTSLHRLLGADPAVVYPYFGGFAVNPLSTRDDLTGAPLHLLAGLVIAIVLAVRWRRLPPAVRPAVVVLAVSWLLFAALVRWQPFNARLHLPLLAATAPLLAVALSMSRPLAGTGVVALLGLGAVPALFGNATRPLFPALALSADSIPASPFRQPRRDGYFNARPALRPSYQALAEAVTASGCDQVGIVAAYDSWEYPLWALTSAAEIRFHHVPPSADPGTECAVAFLEPGPRPAGGTVLWSDRVMMLWRPEPR